MRYLMLFLLIIALCMGQVCNQQPADDDGTNDGGNRLASGVYVARIEGAANEAATKLVLIR